MSLQIFRTGLISSLAIFSLFQICTASAPTDSTEIDSSITDSLSVVPAPDSAAVDSTGSKDQIDAPIYYWTDKGTVSRVGNKIYLEGNAKIVYQDLTLEAEKIMIDQESHFLFAEGVELDSLDSLGNPVIKGLPVFSEKGREPIHGNTIFYDFKTKRGKINYGKTQMNPGYYKGERIDKIGTRTLLVKDGYFTSCEHIDNPHFYFKSTKMRVKMEDNIVAKPVYLYIADIPVFVLPFGVFPSRGGRRSGLLIPTYGESTYGGRFLKNIGYYWAPSDYFDATFVTDFYDKLGITYNTDINYTVRYKLNGRFTGFYFPKDPNTGQDKTRWAVRFNHKHDIDPTLSINATGQFQSDENLAKDLASDVRARTNQLLTSNLTVNKSFKGTKNSLSLNMGITQNLNTGQRDVTLPNLRFARSQSTIVETFTGKSITGDRSWYENIYFAYNGNLLHRESKIPIGDDTTDTFEYRTKEGVEHRLSFNSPNKFLKYFNLTPAISYNEVWVSEITAPVYDPETGEVMIDSLTNRVVTEQQGQFASRRTFNGSLGIRTTLYGMFEPNIGSLQLIRHKMDPQITYTISPDFSQSGYGYYTYVYDSLGNEYPIDKFSKNPFSSTPTRKGQRLTFSLANLFQGKIVSGEEEEKIDLFVLNFRSGYDFERDSLNWDDISTNFRSTPIKGINLNLTARHSIYKRKSSGSGSINETVFSDGIWPRLLSLTASTAFSIDNKMFQSKEEEKKKDEEISEEDNLENEGILQAEQLQVERLSDEDAAKNLDIPWRINFNLNYTMNRNNINNVTERFDVGTTASLSLTKNWRINWTARFDAIKQEITYQSFSIYRDLHCWEMSFNWQPSFGYYSFQINVKESILKDLKVTKRPSGQAYY